MPSRSPGGGHPDGTTRSPDAGNGNGNGNGSGTGTTTRPRPAGMPSDVDGAHDFVQTVATQGRSTGNGGTAADPATTRPAGDPANPADPANPGRPSDSQLAHDAIHGDVSTNPGEAVFWSGRSPDGDDDFVYAGPDRAMAMARDRGMTTLEGLIEERGLQMPAWDADNPAVVESWTRISERYAAGVSGDVHVILGEQVRPGAVWETEFETLQRNPDVDSITKIDLTTGDETVLWERGP